MKERKKYHRKHNIFVLFILLMFSFTLLLFVITDFVQNGIASSDIHYTFSSNVLYNNTQVENDLDDWNIRTNSYNELEVDKWEFALQSMNVLNPNGLDNPNGWTDYEGTGDIININVEGGNMDCYVYGYSAAYNYGQFRDDFNETFTILDVSFTFRYSNTSDLRGYHWFEIFGLDDTTKVNGVRFFNNLGHSAVIQYNDGTWNDIGVIPIIQNTDITLSISVNDTSDKAIVIITSSFYNNTFTNLDLANSDIGFGKIYWYITPYLSVRYLPICMDSIGVYIDDRSLSDEIAYRLLDINTVYNSHTHNLFYNIVNSKSDICYYNYSLIEGSYLIGETMYSLMNRMLTYNNSILSYVNLYDLDYSLTDVQLLIYVANYHYIDYIGIVDTRDFKINEISFNGVRLYDKGTYRNLEYSCSTYTDSLFSFFYLQGTRLYFNLTTENSNTEYIQAVFDISYQSTTNYSILYKGYFTNNVIVRTIMSFSVIYLDTSSYSFTRDYEGGFTFSQALSQYKAIDEFYIVITDNDNDLASGTITYGYISEITLIYYPNIEYSIITTTLLLIMIPLIVILSPALIIRIKFGSLGLLIMMLFMCIVCYIGNLIPLWVFFMNIIAIGVGLIENYK